MEAIGAPAAKVRDVTFDILKGIGIAEVFIHHSFSFSARKYAAPQSLEWWGLLMTNRLLHFAIPTFLLVSALLLARSLSKTEKPNIARYLDRRVVRTLRPYIVWSLIYLFARAYVVKVGSDIYPYTVKLPGGWAITGPNVFLDPAELKYYFLWGKAYFHLYFLSVLLQLSIALPLIVWMLKRVRFSFATIALTSVFLQFAMYLLQANVWRSPHPASTVAWYVPPLLIGSWLGMNWQRWPAVWQQSRGWILSLAILSGVPYLWLSALEFQDVTVSNLAHNASLATYGTTMALLILGLSGSFKTSSKPAAILASLGAISLPLFVIHPAILHLMGGPTITSILDSIPFSPLVVLGLVLGITLAISRILIWLRLDMFLFGRRYAVEAALTRVESPARAAAP